MFGRKKNNQQADTVTVVPKLNAEPYHGPLEEADQLERASRKKKAVEADLQDLWQQHRLRLGDNVATGFSRYLYGGFWGRLWALLFDLLLVFALQALVMGIINYFLVQSLAAHYPTINYTVEKLVLILYFTLSSYWLNGQTIGKALLGFQVVANDNYRLPFAVAFIREGLGKLILLQFPFLALFAIVSPKRQNFMDFFTDTNVISLKQFKLLYEENKI